MRVLLSLAMLGFMLFIVIRLGKPPKKVPAAPSFRSRAPSSEGTRSFAWIPRYPGATVTNIRTRVTESELSYGFEFHADDEPAAIVEYFERGLRGAGLTVTTRRPSASETNLHAEASGPTRTIDVGVDKVQAGTLVTVSAEEK